MNVPVQSVYMFEIHVLHLSLLSSVSKYYFSIYMSSKYLQLLLGVFALVFNLFIELVYTVNYFKCTESLL